MDSATRQQVRERAGDCCEYCRLAQANSPLARLQIEHVIPKKHGGADSSDNLALACIDCNLHKGSNLSGLDPFTGELTRLYHPRNDVWDDHFDWEGVSLIGKTDVGRTTIAVLEMNSEDRLMVRMS